jgi:hypothetical protein
MHGGRGASGFREELARVEEKKIGGVDEEKESDQRDQDAPEKHVGTTGGNFGVGHGVWEVRENCTGNEESKPEEGANEQWEWENAGKRGKGAKRLEKADRSWSHPIHKEGLIWEMGMFQIGVQAASKVWTHLGVGAVVPDGVRSLPDQAGSHAR